MCFKIFETRSEVVDFVLSGMNLLNCYSVTKVATVKKNERQEEKFTERMTKKVNDIKWENDKKSEWANDKTTNEETTKDIR